MAQVICKLGVQQRVLPTYRVPFVEQLAKHFPENLSVFSGAARSEESIALRELNVPGVRHVMADNLHFGAGVFYMCWQRGLINWLEAWQPDVLVVEANPRYLSAPKAIRWMHKKRRSVLGWGLGVSKLSGPVGILRGIQRNNFLNMLDGIISYSEQGAEEYRQFGFPEERVFVAHNAAVMPPETMLKKQPFNERAAILFVGRLQRRKRLEVLFQACATIPLHLQPNVIIAGDGPDRGCFESFANEIYPDAQFVGAKFGDELNQYFQQADLFVLPGTGGLAVQQAMGHGLPVIVAEGDGTQNDLVRPDNGWLIKPGDLGSLADSLTQALSDPENLLEMGRESYRITKEEINLEKMAESFATAIKKISASGLRR